VVSRCPDDGWSNENNAYDRRMTELRINRMLRIRRVLGNKGLSRSTTGFKDWIEFHQCLHYTSYLLKS
jgi:hypothetical protein